MVATSDARPRVLIVSSKGEWAGLVHLPHILHRCGARVTVLADEDAPAGRSRFVERHLHLPSDIQKLPNALQDHLADHRYDWIILGDDPTVVALAEAAERHPKMAGWMDEWFPVDRRNGLGVIYSKAAFTEACQQHGVPVPRSRVCNTLDETIAAAREIGYPLMLKAATGMAGNGVIKVNRYRELAAAYRQLADRMPIVVQEFAVGQLGTTQLVIDGGRVLYWLPTFVTQCCPEPYGPSCVRQFLNQADLDRMKPIVDAVATMTNFRGICGIDWIRRADGSFALLEFNPRPTPAMEMGRFVGIDCSAAVRQLLGGVATPQSPQPAEAGNETIYMFPQHLTRCLRYGHLADLRHWLPGAARHDIAWCEPMLVARQSWRLLKLAGHRLLKSLKPSKPSKPVAAKPFPAPYVVRADGSIARLLRVR